MGIGKGFVVAKSLQETIFEAPEIEEQLRRLHQLHHLYQPLEESRNAYNQPFYPKKRVCNEIDQY